MEADWSVEIGSDSPLIEGYWEGFVDLRGGSETVDSLTEAAQHPALREALLALNSDTSLVFTTKCDAWTLDDKEVDPHEFDAPNEDARVGFASYIDILERDSLRFASFEMHEQRAREMTTRLRTINQRQGRVDIVIRSAVVNGTNGYGLTLYAAGCGSDAAAARTGWETVLQAAVAATIAAAADTLPMGE